MDYFSLRSTGGTAGHDNSEFAHLCLSTALVKVMLTLKL